MEHLDCIIVLANEMNKLGNLNEESTARIQLGCETFSKFSQSTMITCGWNYRKDASLFIGNVLKNYAIEVGVPAKQIIAELNSRDTVGDAFFTKFNIVKNKDWKNILVVTSDYHVARTRKIFEFIYGPQYNIEVIGADEGMKQDKVASEKKSIEAFEQTFLEIEPGDDQKIAERITSHHPFYNGKIYSKINLKNRILFLGPISSPLCYWLADQGENIFVTDQKISVEFIKNYRFDFLISYGYRHILKKEVLDLFPDTAINLHISLLPYNRGADPNFWSFIEDTPKGVTIHFLDPGIDTGDILVQKELHFNEANETLSSTYQQLQSEIQQLFYDNWEDIKTNQLQRIPQTGIGTMHKVKDKKPLLFLLEKDGWNTKIAELLKFGRSQKNNKII